MISPLTLPQAAGLSYANGDVRHLTPQDANQAQTLALSTRNLAERDNIIVGVINQLIEQVNNKEQIVDLQVPKVFIGPSQSIVVLNYRIPAGFEARVLNAIVSSTPVGQARLDVMWSSTYGATTGTSVSSTLYEVSGQTVFYAEGEFVVKLTNIGSSSLEVSGDVHITMRPVAQIQGALLTPSVVVGTSGFSGYSGSGGVSGYSGNQGASGFSGTSGYSGPGGKTAYTTTSASFTMPAIGGTVTGVAVVNSDWMSEGQIVYVETAGYMIVDNITSTTLIDLTNPSPTYAGNLGGGNTVSSGSTVGPGGIKGTDGTNPSTSTVSTANFAITYTYVGAVAGEDSDGYIVVSNTPSSTFTVAEVTVAAGTGSLKLVHGQLRLLLAAGTITLALPASSTGQYFTVSNTSLTATVDDSTVAGGQIKKEASGSPYKVWTLTIPAAYVTPVKVSITYLGFVYVP
jgi:hypothetical protein